MYFILTIVLSLITIGLSVLLFYALRRINQYETLFLEVSDTVDFIQMRIDSIDTAGTYKSDDEVGWFWDEVVKLSGMLSVLFQQVYEKGEPKDGEEKEKK